VNTRTLALVLLALEGAVMLAPWVPAPEWIVWPLRLAAAAGGVALLPGAALALWLLPGRTWRPTELVAVAFGASAALVQLALIASLTLHFGAVVTLGLMAVLTTAALVRVAVRPPHPAMVTTWAELAWWAGVLALAAFLYAEGTPYEQGEDFLHIGVIRRLAELSNPAITNIYFVPGVIYTYPFPGIHYLMALMSRLGDVDAVFVYHKLRFFWGPIALAMVAMVGRQLFGSMTWGLACGATALAFVAAGTFSDVEGFFWGQLAPFSHASDVAMGVLLPATLVYMLAFLQEERRQGVPGDQGNEDRRASRFFFVGSLALALMLTIVHVRELVQVLVYLGAFVLALLFLRRDRALLVRSSVLLGAVLVIAAGFNIWHAAAVGHIDSIVGARRAQLVEVVRNAGPLGLLVRVPLAYFDGFVPNTHATFSGWNPFLLLAAAPVLLAFRTSPLVWLIAASMLCYVLIIRFPLFGAPYIYLTYFEILFTPIRNVIFFLHVIAGAVVFLATAALGRAGLVIGVLLTVAGSLAVGGAWRLPRMFFEQHQDLLFVPVIALLVWTLVMAHRSGATGRTAVDDSAAPSRELPRRRRLLGAAAALTALSMVAVWFLTAGPARAVQVRWNPDVGNAERIFHEWRWKLAGGLWREGTTWSYSILDTSRDNVSRIVRSPAVLDTHEVNRAELILNKEAPVGWRDTWAGAGLPIIGSPDGFELTVLLLIGVAVVCLRPGTRRSTVVDVRDPAWRHPRPALFAVAVVVLASLTWTPGLSPFVIEQTLKTPDEAVATLGCAAGNELAPYAPAGVEIRVEDMMSCPPTPAVMKWVREHVPPAGVFAANTWNSYPPSVFFPQQYLGWAKLTPSFLSPEQLFGPYLQFYRRALTTYGAQPMFNDKETARERREFVDALGVTHVLVDPAYHDVVTHALAGSDDFTKEYDDGRWAVFAVRPRAESRQAE
jgi:hypothetical protein